MSTEICQSCGKFTSYKTGGADTESGFMCKDCLIQCTECGKAFSEWMILEECDKCGSIIE